MTRNADEWSSAHLHFPGDLYGHAADSVITSVVAPLVGQFHTARMITGHFFIRYGDGGPHIHFRVRRAAGVEERDIRRLILARTGDLTVRWVPYEPEIRRYAGPAALRVAERFFEVSSDITIRLLDSGPLARSQRLARGLLGTLVLLHTFGRTREWVSSFAHRYNRSSLQGFAREEGAHDGWRNAFDSGYAQQSAHLSNYVHETWERLTRDEPLTETLDAYRAALAPLPGRLAAACDAGLVAPEGAPITSAFALQWVTPSYVHMAANRLGVSIPEEAYLTYLLARSLGQDNPTGVLSA